MDNTDASWAAMWAAIKEDDAAAIAGLLDDAPSLVDQTNDQGISPLMMACYCSAGEALAEIRSRKEVLSVHEAAAVGDDDRVRACLADAPGIVDSFSADGWTALHLAAFFGHLPAVQALLAAGAPLDVLSKNGTGNTPLHAAIAGAGDTSVVQAIVDAGSDVNQRGEAGITPLHLAGARGDVATIDLLLARGAWSSAMDDGKTPADLADERGHPDAAARLRDGA